MFILINIIFACLAEVALKKACPYSYYVYKVYARRCINNDDFVLCTKEANMLILKKKKSNEIAIQCNLFRL